MKKLSGEDKKRIKALNTQVKELQGKLVQAEKLEGKDAYVSIVVDKKQARFIRIKQKGVEDKAEGRFFTELAVTAKQQDVYFPLSVASGKKTAGFMYQIEGTAEGTIVTTDIKVQGKGVTLVTVGTLVYAKIPAKGSAAFKIQVVIRGSFAKRYKIVFTRLNYKLMLTDARYQQYLKEIHSESVLFS